MAASNSSEVMASRLSKMRRPSPLPSPIMGREIVLDVSNGRTSRMALPIMGEMSAGQRGSL